MKIVIILICLVLARYAHTENMLRQWHWIDRYLKLLHKPLQEANTKSPWLGFAVIMVPVLLGLLIIWKLISGDMRHVIHFIISIAVLWYCLSVISIKQELSAYHDALLQEGKTDAGNAVISLLGSDLPQDKSQIPRAITHAIFWQPLQRIFGVLFWFIALGPVGALGYHMLIVLREEAMAGNSDALSISGEAKIAQAVLDWLPARVVGLGYALAGHFAPTFTYWIKNISAGLEQTQDYLSHCGMLALTAKETDPMLADPSEHRAALALVGRTLIILLALVLIFYFGMWVYR